MHGLVDSLAIAGRLANHITIFITLMIEYGIVVVCVGSWTWYMQCMDQKRINLKLLSMRLLSRKGDHALLPMWFLETALQNFIVGWAWTLSILL